MEEDLSGCSGLFRGDVGRFPEDNRMEIRRKIKVNYREREIHNTIIQWLPHGRTDGWERVGRRGGAKPTKKIKEGVRGVSLATPENQ